MKCMFLKSTIALSLLVILSGCNQSMRSASQVHHSQTVSQIATESTSAQGIVSASYMSLPAQVQVKDFNGQVVQGKTDVFGRFSLKIDGLKGPLIFSAKEQGQQCTDEGQLMGVCLASIYMPSPHKGDNITVNINPLTDQIVSDVAGSVGYVGPQQLVNAPNTQKVTPTAYQEAMEHLDQTFAKAFKQAQLPQGFSPITYSATWQAKVDSLNDLIWENRGYKSHKGLPSQIMMLDKAFRPIGDKNLKGEVIPVDLTKIKEKLNRIKKAKYRIFIVGDSTASIYTHQQFPRMGWGQIFQERFDPAEVQVIDGAQSGRSSRLYRNQGWFRNLANMMRPGDYLFIQMAHNDEKCNGAKKGRGPVDVANLCTYPNTAKGELQHPKARPDMSFENSLEFYINYARQHDIHPVLLTPTTRFKNAHGHTKTPIVHRHYTKHASGYAFSGDYTQTIRDTARKNHVPLLEVEKGTIKAANRIGNAHWRDYWLGVDPKIYPYYSHRTGHFDKPDSTHFQQRGARMVGAIVVKRIKENAQLHTLSKYLK